VGGYSADQVHHFAGGCIAGALLFRHGMTAESKPLVYLILGSAGSGRRELVADLIDGSREPGERTVVLISEGESASEADSRLPGLASWKWTGDAIRADWPRDSDRVFFVTDGRLDPVDQVEAFRDWMRTAGQTPARVLCVVDCGLASRNHPALLGWYEACVHFSDVVLLNRREGVENKWVSDFRAHFEKQFMPCLFENVRKGRVANPALVLSPEARRMSQVFDDETALVLPNGAEISLDSEDDDDAAAEGESNPEDPYFVRDAAGRRSRRIPDITRFMA
jgi:hypothetical protein